MSNFHKASVSPDKSASSSEFEVVRGDSMAGKQGRSRSGPGRLSAAAAADLPDRLLDAAAQLFVERGFAATSMEGIARRAGASTKTLYKRYVNKVEILVAVIRRNVERTVARQLREFALRPEDSEPREFLVKFATQIGLANRDQETAAMQRLSFAEADRSPILRRTYYEVTGRGIDAVANALSVWRDVGKLSFALDPQDAAAMFLALTTHEIRIRAVLGDSMSRSEIADLIATSTDLFLSGLSNAVKSS